MVIILILLLSLVLRLVNLNQSLWLDESVQAIVSQGSFSSLFANLGGDFHPPIYHFLIWFWIRMFGTSEIALRAPSVLFGVMSVFGFYLLVKLVIKNGNNLIKYFFTVFFATSPFHIYYSQEARMYSLVTFATIFSMYFFLKIFENNKNKNIIPYILFTSLMILSDYFGFFILGTQVLFLIYKRKFNYLKYLILAMIPFIFWFPNFLVQLKVGNESVKMLPEWGKLVNLSFVKAIPLTIIKFTIGRITLFNKVIYGLLSGFLFILYGFIFLKVIFKLKTLKEKDSFVIILFWFLIPLLIAQLISFFVPSYQPFRLLLILPAFYLFLMVGITAIKNRVVQYSLLVLFLIINLVSLWQYYSNPYFRREDWRSTSSFIKENQKLDSLAIIPSNSSHFPLTYYGDGEINFIGVTGVSEVNDKDLMNLAIQLNNKNEIYFINYLSNVFDPKGKITDTLNKYGFSKMDKVSFNQIELWVYKK